MGIFGYGHRALKFTQNVWVVLSSSISKIEQDCFDETRQTGNENVSFKKYSKSQKYMYMLKEVWVVKMVAVACCVKQCTYIISNTQHCPIFLANFTNIWTYCIFRTFHIVIYCMKWSIQCHIYCTKCRFMSCNPSNIFTTSPLILFWYLTTDVLWHKKHDIRSRPI